MRVTTSDTVITPGERLSLSIDVENNSNRDAFILDFDDFSTDTVGRLYRLVIEKEGKIKKLPRPLINRRWPSSGDYKKVEAKGKKRIVTHDLHLEALQDVRGNRRERNIDYGKYTIQVIYKNGYRHKKMHAFSSIKSNVVTVRYVPRWE